MSVSEVVQAAAVVPVLPAGTYWHYSGTATVFDSSRVSLHYNDVVGDMEAGSRAVFPRLSKTAGHPSVNKIKKETGGVL